jgi:hypothetical protein
VIVHDWVLTTGLSATQNVVGRLQGFHLQAGQVHCSHHSVPQRQVKTTSYTYDVVYGLFLFCRLYYCFIITILYCQNNKIHNVRTIMVDIIMIPET